MATFSEKVKNILLKAGWKDGKRIDPNPFKEYLQRQNYAWFPAVELFLAEFGDLEIVYPRADQKEDLLHFKVQKAVDDIDPLWVKEDYCKKLNNQRLCVVGQAYTSHLTLIMSDIGEVFGGYDEELYFIGNTGKDAIETICLDRKLQQYNN